MFTIKVNVGDAGMALDKPQLEIAKGNRERVRLVFEGTGQWADIEHTSGFTVTFSDGTEVTSDCGSCFVPQELFDLDEFGFTVKMGDLTSANGVTIAPHVPSSGCTCEGAGGGGAGAFVVNVSTTDGQTFTADKTFAETLGALQAGQTAEAHINLGTISAFVKVMSYTSGEILFGNTTVNDTTLSIAQIRFSSDETIQYNVYTATVTKLF